MTRSAVPNLESYLGGTVASVLPQWGGNQGFEVSVPARPWRPDTGYTGARLRSVVVTEHATGRRAEVILKICRPDRPEGDGHRRAWSDCAERPDLRAHLVEPYLSDWPAADGSVLTMQRFAAEGAQICLLSDLTAEQRADALLRVARWLAEDWNGDGVHESTSSVADLLSDQLAGPLLTAGSITNWESTTPLRDRTARRLRLVREGPALPNPLFLTTRQAPALRFRVLRGRVHGDLHLDNVVVPLTGSASDPDRFQLIDLATYDVHSPLTLDPVTLMLSSILRDPPLPAPPVVLERCRRWPGTADLGDGPVTVALLGTALLFTTFEGLGADARWWCFTLACHAAHRLTVHHGLDVGTVDEAPLVDNPFTTVPAVTRRPPGRLVRAARQAARGDHDAATATILEAMHAVVRTPDPHGVSRLAGLDELRADAVLVLGALSATVREIDYRRVRATLHDERYSAANWRLLRDIRARADAAGDADMVRRCDEARRSSHFTD